MTLRIGGDGGTDSSKDVNGPASARGHLARVMPEGPEQDVATVAIGLVPVLLDLTYYGDQELVSAALGLLVRQFEQRKVLEQAGRKVHTAFDHITCHFTRDPPSSHLSRLCVHVLEY